MVVVGRLDVGLVVVGLLVVGKLDGFGDVGFELVARQWSTLNVNSDMFFAFPIAYDFRVRPSLSRRDTVEFDRR